MDNTMDEKTKMLLGPYRVRIDELDKQIIDLLRLRYDIIEEVGLLKADENIASTLQDRVDEVRENAVQRAKKQNLDSEFIGKLYAQLIGHSCAVEEEIIQKTREQAQKSSSL